MPLYDVNTAEFPGLKETLAYVMLMGDEEEVFLHMAVRMNRISILYNKQQKGERIHQHCFRETCARNC